MTDVQADGSTIDAKIGLAENQVIRAYRLLGGEEVVKTSVRNALDAHDLIVHGISSRSLVHLVDAVPVLSMGDVLSKAVGVSLRTLQRRRSEASPRPLSIEQSSRAWKFAEIFAHATDVMGGMTAAEDWLLEPAIGLDNRKPIDLIATAAGAEAVEDYLTRLEYGVYT